MLRRSIPAAVLAAAAAVLGVPVAAHAAVTPSTTIKWAEISPRTLSGTATCDAGQVATGGGYWIASTLGGSSYVARNYPLDSRSWYVQTVGMAGWVYVDCLSLTTS
jgi:hypothetical protein